MLTFQERLEEAGYETSPYSGRAMYGKHCLSTTINRAKLGDFIADVINSLSEQDIDNLDVCSEFRGMKTDSMGAFGMVLYFPDIPYTNPDEG